MSAQVLALLILFIVFGLPIIGATLIALAKVMRKGQAAEEARMVQELNASLARFEERIDALETIILERDREQDKKSL